MKNIKTNLTFIIYICKHINIRMLMIILIHHMHAIVFKYADQIILKNHLFCRGVNGMVCLSQLEN